MRGNLHQVRLISTALNAVIAASVLVGAAMAQDVSTSSTLLLKFLDARSGGAVAPRSLMIDGQKAAFQVEAGSLVALPMADGRHKISVDADGYAPLEVDAEVAGADTPVMEVELDSADSFVEEPLAEGVARLEGNVSDSDTGALLPGVKLTLPESGMTTTTAESGRFLFDVQVPRLDAESRAAITLEARAEGYTTLLMKNLALAEGERRRMPLKLNRITSDTATLNTEVTDEAAADGPLRTYEWVYDVSLR